jgi:putative SOS response-associated peptidase YedK
MCGRFTITVSLDDLKSYLKQFYQIDLEDKLFDLPKYNVSPGTDVIAIIFDGKKYRVGLLKWGFIPNYAKDDKQIIINAKAETIDEKISFKKSFESKRCLILADGFYEWAKSNGEKTPMRITKKDQSLFPMAGLYNTYQNADGTKIHSACIITTEANEIMKPIHDRMPVIFDNKEIIKWFTEKDSAKTKNLLKPYDSNQMEAYRVSKRVNDAKNQDQSLILKI